MMSNGFNSQLNLTVFTSDDLPINIVKTDDAEEFYRNAFGSDLMAVPKGKENFDRFDFSTIFFFFCYPHNITRQPEMYRDGVRGEVEVKREQNKFPKIPTKIILMLIGFSL